MNGKNVRSAGFSLLEVLIVVLVIGILAVAIIPQLSNTKSEAQVATARFNLRTIRSQIELYKLQHEGRVPSADLHELTGYTNSTGAYTAEAGPSFPYGPYFISLPMNPLARSRAIGPAPADGGMPAAAVSGFGWLYDATTGTVWCNDSSNPPHIPFSQQ